MSIKLDFTSAINEAIDIISHGVTSTQDSISTSNIPSAIVWNEMSAKSLKVLFKKHADYMNEGNKDWDLILRLKMNIEFCAKAIAFLQIDTTDVDPSVLKVFQKIENLKSKFSINYFEEDELMEVQKKIEKYSLLLASFPINGNEQTLQTRATIENMIEHANNHITYLLSLSNPFTLSDESEEATAQVNQDFAWEFDDAPAGENATTTTTTTTTTTERPSFEGIFTERTPTIQDLAPTGLLHVIESLSLLTDEGFFNALEGMAALRDGNVCLPFPITGNVPSSVYTRIFFHMYHIHDKETPTVVNRKDFNYGLTAFNEEGRSTPEQKLRAAQRTLLEICLFEVEHASDQGNKESLAIFLKAVEEMQLDPKDLPANTKNIAHALFGKLYTLYSKAQKEDSSLEHPHSSKFKGDFGRHAFCGTAEIAIPKEYVQQALKEVLSEIKAVWKV